MTYRPSRRRFLRDSALMAAAVPSWPVIATGNQGNPEAPVADTVPSELARGFLNPPDSARPGWRRHRSLMSAIVEASNRRHGKARHVCATRAALLDALTRPFAHVHAIRDWLREKQIPLEEKFDSWA